MILYHGSNVGITEIDLSFSKRGKDFGVGFYLNDNLLQAKKMAKRTTSRMAAGEATISAFEFDETCLQTHSDNLKSRFLKIIVWIGRSLYWRTEKIKPRNRHTVTI